MWPTGRTRSTPQDAGDISYYDISPHSGCQMRPALLRRQRSGKIRRQTFQRLESNSVAAPDFFPFDQTLDRQGLEPIRVNLCESVGHASFSGYGGFLFVSLWVFAVLCRLACSQSASASGGRVISGLPFMVNHDEP